MQCRYLIDKGIAALIPAEDQSRTIRAPPIKNVAPRESCPTAHEERRCKQPHSDETKKSVRYFHATQDAAKVSCQRNDQNSNEDECPIPSS